MSQLNLDAARAAATLIAFALLASLTLGCPPDKHDHDHDHGHDHDHDHDHDKKK